MTKMQKGQIFSIDFLIAATLTVLAIGLLLGYYETAATYEKETRMKNEFTAIALNASSILLEKNPCIRSAGFSSQGYNVTGCSEETNFNNFSKTQLMIPTGFNCYIHWEGPDPYNGTLGGCNQTDPGTTPLDIVSIQRPFVSPPLSTGLTKAGYEKCIEENNCQDTYLEFTLTVKIWK
ncbi:MAG TPA: hypothetical protein VJG83_06130 [archaeon]|nr:hypothetical protein [archaeon]